MEVKEVNLKRFVAKEGKALKWKVKSWLYNESKPTEGYRWSPYDAVIDINELIGEVEEIPFEQYKEETKLTALCGTIFN